jgi:tRNA-splicing ligase RtcB
MSQGAYGHSSTQIPIHRIDKFVWEIPQDPKAGMRVPGRIYADEALIEKMRTDATLQQCANVATLPGLYKWSITMPDGHEGYGFPIGGVAASDYDEGVVSPGGIGYDINCLTGDALVLTELGYRMPIREVEGSWQQLQIRCVKRSSLTSARIAAFQKQPNDKQAYRVRTRLGYQVIATQDHPFLTPSGMIEASSLHLKDRVAVHGFEGVSYENPDDFTIVSKHRMMRLNIPANNRSVAQELRSRDLLPLRPSSSKLPYLLKLFGYILGDGSLIFTPKSAFIWFWGKPEDLEDIREDVRKLGYSPVRIYTRIRKAKITSRHGTRSFRSTEHGFYVHARSLAALLMAMGVPQGAKASQGFVLPRWIFRLPLWQKRLLLGAMFGAELSSPAPVAGHPKTMASPLLTQSKHRSVLPYGIRFMRQISRLLSQFGVQCSPITVDLDTNRTRNGTQSSRVRLQISELPENLIRFWGTVGFEYNRRKSRLAALAVNYLKLKRLAVLSRSQIAKTALTLRSVGSSKAEIYDSLRDSGVNERFLERSIYEPRKTDPRIPESFPTFAEFSRDGTQGLGSGGSSWDEIVAIEPVDLNEPVYDFTVADASHNFIANGLVVSNCGVRLIRTSLTESDVRPVLGKLLDSLFTNVPSGLGSRGKVGRLSSGDLEKVMREGVEWAIEHGYGWAEDRNHCEENGCMERSDPDKVSGVAKQRGSPQLGSLGSGNHFLEIEKVDKVLDQPVAEKLGIRKEGQILVLVHTGSRGFGYQICSDYLRVMERAIQKYGIRLPDRQLACAPAKSNEVEDYIGAMSAAANFAWSNRQMITHWARESFEKVFGKPADQLDMALIYDVAHNIAKIEEHDVDGKRKKVYVHRKGATRAFPPDHPAVPAEYREIGQPVLIPGSMGTSSWVLIGTPKSMQLSFGTTAHGAGRFMSRAAARRRNPARSVEDQLAKRGIMIRAENYGTVSEEAPEAYKNVDAVAEVSHQLGIATKVARLVPIGVTKG